MERTKEMEEWKVKLVKALEKSGKNAYKYFFNNLKFDVDFQINEREDFINNSKKGIKWFVGQTFWQGRRDWLSDVYRRAFFRAFDSIYGSEEITANSFEERKVRILVEKFESEVKKLEKKSGEPYEINLRDKKRVEDIFLKFLPRLEKYQYNPVRFVVEEIKNGNLVKLFREEFKVYGMGTKIKSFILREIVQVFDLEELIKKDIESLKLLFPVDTHVRQIIQLIWSEVKGKKDEKLAEYAIEECKKLKVSPLYFNSGCWVLGFNAQEAFDILMGRIK